MTQIFKSHKFSIIDSKGFIFFKIHTNLHTNSLSNSSTFNLSMDVEKDCIYTDHFPYDHGRKSKQQKSNRNKKCTFHFDSVLELNELTVIHSICFLRREWHLSRIMPQTPWNPVTVCDRQWECTIVRIDIYQVGIYCLDPFEPKNCSN